MPEDLNAKEAHLEERLKKITELETEIKKREKAIKEKEKAKTSFQDSCCVDVPYIQSFFLYEVLLQSLLIGGYFGQHA